MGALASFKVSEGSKQFFDLTVADKALDFVRDHPVMTRLAAVAFPPASGAVMAMEVAEKLRSVMIEEREDVTQAWKESREESGALPLLDRLDVVLDKFQASQPQTLRQRAL